MMATEKRKLGQAMTKPIAMNGPVSRKSGVAMRQTGVVLVMALIALVAITRWSAPSILVS